MGIDLDEPDFQREKGEDWFLRQSEADQRVMMGNGMWEAWDRGAIKLGDIPKLVKSDVWGDSWVPRSLKDLMGASLRGFEGKAMFVDIGSATGRALFGGDIGFDRSDFAKLNDEARRFTIGHEIAHHTIEDYVLKNQAEWDLAEQVLTVRESRERRLFVGGHLRIGESISDSVPMAIFDDWPQSLTEEKTKEVSGWVRGVSGRAGYSLAQIERDIERILMELTALL